MASRRFEGRHVLVSGGAAGVGGEASRLFAEEGARVSIVDVQNDAADELAETLMENGAEAIAIPADVSSEADIHRAVHVARERFGCVDVLYNHAGTVIVKPFLAITYAEWVKLFQINVHSMFLMSRLVLDDMVANGGGVIVNTGSISASLATPMEAAYCTTKAACEMLTKAIATEYRDRNVRCNTVSPGFIATNHGLREIDALRDLDVDVSEADIASMQGRICEPVEVARAVLFLASDEASFVNGETLVVDNGLSVRT